MVKPKRFKCNYCNKKYVGWNFWFFKHFTIYHDNKKIACIRLQNG